ncbi:MAG: hypothetical protein LBP27_07340, partial [Treponema sp.]|nr:hypothetical protein [Treponema sp.]
EQVENALLVPNAALRYQPASLSASEIDEKIFNAGLAGMSEEERGAALAARAETRKTAADRGGNAARQGGGLAGLAASFGMGGGRMRVPGGGQNANSGAGGADRVRPLWYIDESGRLDCMLVRAGISDGINTAIRPARQGGRTPRADSAGAGQEPAAGGSAPPAARSFDSGPEGMRVILRERI